MRSKFAAALAWLMFVGACSEAEEPAPRAQHEVTATAAPLWSNGDFENDSIGATPPSGWTVTTYLNAAGVTGSSTAPPSSFNALNLSAGGKVETYVIGGPVEGQTDPDLGAGQSFRYPKYGARAARVNYKNSTDYGKNENANGLRQTMTIELGDIDPNDGQIHVRFVVAPVLENPSHGYTQQPYYFIQLQNLTRGTVLYHDFNVAGQAGVPWHTTTSVATGNTTQWLNWQLVDLAPGPAAIGVGDSVQLTVVGSGCQPGGHFGRVYVDGVGPSIPGLFTWATGPASVAANGTITYTIYYSNGGSSSALGAHVDMTTPPQTTFQSVSGTGTSNCTTPSTNAAGTISCPLGSLAPGSSGSFTVTVKANSGASGSITNGTYSIGAVNSSDLLGAKVSTTVISGSISDAKVTQTANVTTTNWGQQVILTIKVKNLGPNNLNKTTTSQLTVADAFPTKLTSISWTCSVSSSGVNNTACDSSSGTGNISQHPKLGSGGGEVTYVVTANVVSGSGSSSFTNTPTATVSSRTDPDPTNNSAPLTLPIGTPHTLTLTKSGSTSSGSVTSAPVALSCGASCSSTTATFLDSSSVILTATPVVSGATFTGWSGACTGSSRTCTLTMSGDLSVTATFAAPPAVGSAANVYAYLGNNQSARTSASFGSKLSALVTDANGNALSNVTVTYTAVPNSNGASASIGTTTKTSAAGVATAVVTANATSGSYTVTAAVSGVSTPATFNLINVGSANAISYVSGGNVTDPNRSPPGVAFPATLTALVTDSNSIPVPGATVTFSAPGSGATATLSSTTATTDSSGFASVTATAGNTVGSYLVHASTTGVTNGIDFSLQNVSSSPASIFVISGSPQHTPTTAAFDNALVVGVADAIGNALSGVNVTFAAPGSGASATLSSTSATTDSLGTASITATANGTLGSYNVTASASGAGSTSFALANDGPQLIDVQSGDPQSVTAGQAFQNLVAIVTDSSTGAPINNATVTFAVVPVNGATAMLGATTATTNSSGLASITATAGTVAGSYTVTASTAQAGEPAVFNLTNAAGSAAAIAATSGGGQHASVGIDFGSPLIATVTDSNGNPVSGVSVTFTPPGSGASATVVGSPATTDASGQASVSVTANATTGAYNVTAAASGAGSALFHLTNDMPPGCAQDSDCMSSEYCDTGAGTCAAQLGNGVAMPTVTGHTPALDGMCNPGEAAVVCASGVCGADNKCGYNTSEGPCDSTSAANVCRSGVCSVSGVCMPSGGCAVGGDCNIPNAGASCNAGSCQLASCNAGYGDCDNSAANGCERALGDVQNCGGCNQACSLAHAVPVCSNGSCAVGGCDPGYGDCDGSAANGCELFVSGSDRNHCGDCSTVCSASQFCSSGSCVMTLANNVSCSSADQCTSGVCSADSLCGVANNGPCSGGSVCRGGACSVSGACMNTGGCLVDGDCTSDKFCDTVQNLCVPKIANGTMLPTIAGHTPALTGACTTLASAAVCVAGVCDTDNACGYENGTGTCSTGNAATLCRSGVCGSDAKCGYPDREGSCDNTTALTICRSLACTSTSHVCSAAGGCNVDGDCTGLQFCDTAAHSCVAKLSNGQALPHIAGHTPVLDGSCSMTVASAVCSAGVCDTGDSRCALRNGQGPCTVNDAATVCRSGVCGGDGLCGYREDEGSCTSVSAGTVCRTGLCSLSSMVCVAANGCQVDADCDSAHYCDTEMHSCVTKLSNGVAMPTTAGHTPALDGHCSPQAGSAVCSAGVCDNADDRCALINGHGSCDNSNAGAVCRSGVCGSDSACGYLDAEGVCTSVDAGNVCRSGECSISGVCRPATGCVVAGDCSFTNAVAACNNGACELASCNAGWSNCNGSAADGCETHSDADSGNCGACGAACPQSHGFEVCSSGSCAVIGCNQGYGDCNNDAADGCETAVRVDDASNCGACGYHCRSDQFCAAGLCTTKRDNGSSCSGDTQCSAGVCTLSDRLCGLADDAPCASATVCRGGACSQSGVCMASDSCRIDADCASDSFCDTGARRCTPKLANATSIPSVAGHDPDLAGLCTPDVGSAVCTSAVCDASDEKCGYANGTGPCVANTATIVCRSGVCGSDGQCGYLDGEGTCSGANAASVCRSGLCANDSHVCVASNQCLTDGDCDATHYCDTSASACTPKLGNAIAIPTVPGHTPDLHASCTLDAGSAVCISSVCDPNDDKCGYLNGDGQCDPSSAGRVCRGGVCGGDGACGYREGEGPCTSVDAGDRCRSGLCSSASHVCVAPNGCSIDADCPSTHFCDTAAHSCTPKLGQGVAIPVIAGHSPQLSGTCSADVAHAVCAAGVCDENDARCGYANRDGSCSTANASLVCRSGVCGSDSACGYLDGQGTCNTANAGDVCRSQLCSMASHVCVAANGCSVDGDCPDTQFCDTAHSRCVPQLDNGVLIPTIAGHSPALTGACSDPVGLAVCNSDVCDGSDARCGYVNGHGTCSAGNAGAVCRSGVCGGDSKCGYRDGEGSCSSANAGNLCRSGLCAASGVCRPAGGCVTASDCQFAHAQATCTNGTCGWSHCDDGYSDCNQTAADGCELQTGGADLANCGGCGQACSAAHATATCNAGVCTIASCDQGQADCDNSAADGCEINVGGDDVANCGACGKHCTDGEFCAAGSCQAKRVNGNGCSVVSECVSGVCASDGVCGSPDGATCSDAAPCRGGACSVAGQCMNIGACRADGDCNGDQFCDTSSSKCHDKLDNGTAIPSIAGHTPALTGACTNDGARSVCASGVCEVADDLCGHINGSACSDASVCRSGVCDADGKCGFADGDGPCSADDASRVCRSGVCNKSVCGAAVGCSADSDCSAAQFCDTGTSTCTAKLGNGTPLPTLPHHDPSASGVCNAAIGGALCAAGVCDTDDACGYLNGHGSCTNDDAATVCRSGACGSDHKCGYLAGEGTCSSVDASVVCRSGLCSDEQRCQAPPSCLVDSDCTDDRFCDTSAHTCTIKLAAGFAIPFIPGHVPPLTGGCNDDIAPVVCSAGVCSDSDDACAFPNELGSCDDGNAGAVCRSGVCGSDQSCGFPEGEGTCTSLNAAHVCRSGVCGSDGQCGPRPPCAADSDCDDTQFCDTDLQQCRSKQRNGTALPLLAAHEPPLTGKCTDAAGMSACISSVCDTADDACGFANGDGSCTDTSAANVCRSRVCGGDQRCGYADGEGPCDAVTAIRVCRNAACSADGVCRARGCVSDAGCKDGEYCELTSGACQTRKVEGGSCGSDSECASGSCDLARGTCNSCVDGVCGHASVSGGGCSVTLGRAGAGALAACVWLAVLGVLRIRRRQRRGSRG